MPDTLSLHAIHNPRPGWYRGDFHCHTLYSDGVLTPPELALGVSQAFTPSAEVERSSERGVRYTGKRSFFLAT